MNSCAFFWSFVGFCSPNLISSDPPGHHIFFVSLRFAKRPGEHPLKDCRPIQARWSGLWLLFEIFRERERKSVLRVWIKNIVKKKEKAKDKLQMTHNNAILFLFWFVIVVWFICFILSLFILIPLLNGALKHDRPKTLLVIKHIVSRLENDNKIMALQAPMFDEK